MKLATQELDCYAHDKLAVFFQAKNLLIDKGKLIPTTFLGQETVHLGYAKNAKSFPFKVDFMRKFDEAIVAMKASGEIDNLVSEWMFKANQEACLP